MPRRRVVAKREILPDPVYGSQLLATFVNRVMRSGKKSVAEKIVYGALTEVANRTKTPLEAKEGEDGGDEGGSGVPIIAVFNKALDNIRPTLEVRSRRVGGATYQVPVEVPSNRRTTLAMRWLIESASGRSEKTMTLRLAGEICDALDGRGSAVKKREDTHRMAKANQAFAHFRWN